MMWARFNAKRQRRKGAENCYRLSVFLCPLASLFFCIVVAHAQAIRWTPNEANAVTNANKIAVEITGLQTSTLQQLQRLRWSSSQWQRLFAVYTDTADIAVLGTYRVQGDALRFEPQFPLEPGLIYRAEFRPAQLPSKINAPPLTSTFRLPPRNTTPTTTVTHVYPSGDVVPENLLKFYVHFSAPMQRGNIYDHIQLRDSDGKVVELPFLEIDEELWDTTLTRLTLFIDPGRIKRGVLPLEEIGPSLQAGKSYTLVIRSAWKDSNGAPLKEEFQKSFRVVAPDREPPDPKRWQVQAPSADSTAPLIITFPEPMDHALTLRLITVVNANGQTVSGQATLADHEQRWLFVPHSAWLRGKYHLVVQTTIEDLAGNNIGKPFEVDLFTGVERHLKTATIRLPFEVP